MGQVIHQNDRLVKPYQEHKKNVDKTIFCSHGNHKTGRFRLFLSIFGSHTRVVGAGAPDMGHVIHQNDRLVKAYRDHKKTLTKSLFVTMATLKLDDFADFLVFSWLLHLFS